MTTQTSTPSLQNGHDTSADALTPERAKHKGQFKKGQSGNPGGRPKELKGIQELARRHSDKTIAFLFKVMTDDKAGLQARVMAAKELLDRGHGKPQQSSDITINPAPFERIERVIVDHRAITSPADQHGSDIPTVTPTGAI